MQTAKILVDLESLFDIRQSLLKKHSTDLEALSEFLLSEEYNFRSSDNFDQMSVKTYDEEVAKADINILSDATITYLITTLRSKIANLNKRNMAFNEIKQAELMVNVYPLVLTKEQEEILQNAIFYKLESETIVTIVSLPKKSITPYFIKTSNITAVFIYDFGAWLNEVQEALQESPLRETMFYAPALYKEEIDKDGAKEIKSLGFTDGFSYMEQLLSTVTILTFLPVTFYSNFVIAKAYLKEFENKVKEEEMEVPEGVDLSKVDIPEEIFPNGNSSPKV